MSESRRVQRVERELQQVIARYLVSGFSEPLSGIVTVSKIQVNADLRNARVFLTFMGEDLDIQGDIELIKSRAADFGHEITKRLRMKFCPKLHFVEDTSLDHQLKIEKILHEIKEPMEANHK